MKAQKRRTIKESKQTSWQNYVKTINPDTPTKYIWEKISKIKGNNTLRQTTTLLKDNIIYKEPQEIVNALADTFEEISSDRHYQQPFLTMKEQTEAIEIQVEENNDHPLNTPFTMWELNTIINNLKNNKSAGPDQIPYEMIKHFSNKTRTFLLQIYNYLWKNNLYPDTWREVIIIPILKPHKNQLLPTSYRPIALSNSLCKVMEKLVNSRLIWHLEANKLISDAQMGFRRNRSTTDQHVYLQNEIQLAFRNKQHLVAVFFDLEKAFDTTWRYNIIKKLQNDNIDGNILNFVKKFLSNRRFKVRSHGCLSNVKIQQNGTPQGASLSSTLFLKAINDVTTNVSFPNKILLFADDLIIFCRGKNIDSIKHQLQTTINKIETWTNNTGFNFSTTKTKAVHFSKLRKNCVNPKLHLKNNEIPYVNTIKFLGLTLDKKLTWKPHLQQLKLECTKRINILKTLSNHEWGANEKTMITIYKMLICSKLDYGSISYSTAKPSTLKILDTIQHTAIRLATGAFRISPIISLQNITHQIPLQYRRMQLITKYFIQISSTPQHPLFSQIFKNVNNMLQIKDTTPLHKNIHTALTQLQMILPKNILGKSISSEPPWLLYEPNCDMQLCKYSKDNTSPEIYKKNFIRIHQQHTQYQEIYTDASKNLDKVGAAVVTENTTHKYRLSKFHSIFTAEMFAIQKSIDIIEENNTRNQNYTIYTDSLSSILTIKNIYPHLKITQNIQEKINNLHKTKNINIKFIWIPSHVNILGNEKADSAAKEASIDAPMSDEPTQTYDFNTKIKYNINNKWKEEWTHVTNNKLKQIKKDTDIWEIDTNRKKQISINRLRIGHTRLTHSHIFQRQPPPECDNCNTRITISHLLLECQKYNLQRQTHNIPPTLEEALNKKNTTKIYTYLKDTKLIQEI